MRIFYGQKLNTASLRAGELFSSSTTYDTYAANVGNPHRTVVWKTGTSSASEWLDLRFSAAVSATAFLIIDHNLTVSDTLTLKANTTQSWGSPPFSQSITPVSGIIAKTFSSSSYRYWRLEITKASAGDQKQIGVVMLCNYYDTPMQPDFDGYSEDLVDPSIVSKSYGGQTYVERLTQYRKISTDFSGASQSFVDSLKGIFQTVGNSGQLVLQVESSGSLTEYVYCRLANSFSRKVSGMDSALVYDLSLDFEELL